MKRFVTANAMSIAPGMVNRDSITRDEMRDVVLVVNPRQDAFLLRSDQAGEFADGEVDLNKGPPTVARRSCVRSDLAMALSLES